MMSGANARGAEPAAETRPAIPINTAMAPIDDRIEPRATLAPPVRETGNVGLPPSATVCERRQRCCASVTRGRAV